MSQELIDAIVGLRMDEAVTLAKRMLAGGTDPLAIIAEGSEAMQVIGRRFAEGEAFIPELIMGGEIMKAISQEVMPGGRRGGAPRGGTVVIGTVHGDIHDIGKDIVVLMLGIGGYAVHDLGIDVPVEDFVAAIKEHDPDIVGLSGLLTLAFDAMKSTVDGIAAAGLRDKVKIMVGGAPVDERCARTRGLTAGATMWATPSSWPPSGPTEAPDGARAEEKLGDASSPTGSEGAHLHFANDEAREKYQARAQLIVDTIRLKDTGRIPVIPAATQKFAFDYGPADLQGGDDRVRQGVRCLRASVRRHGLRRLRRPRVHLPGRACSRRCAGTACACPASTCPTTSRSSSSRPST